MASTQRTQPSQPRLSSALTSNLAGPSTTTTIHPQQQQSSISGLPLANLPLDQLNQLQKRLQALVSAIGQFQAEIAQLVPREDTWPVLLSRFGTLVSQTYSLSSLLISPSSSFLPAQLDYLSRTLTEEAKTENYFFDTDVNADGGQPPSTSAASSSKVPRVNYSDPRNPLPRLVVAPVQPIEGERYARLGEALRTKLDDHVEEDRLAALSDEFPNDDPSNLTATAVDVGANTDADGPLKTILTQLQSHDVVSDRALRAWYHVRWRPDEFGQMYDFKMRLDPDDHGEIDDEGTALEGGEAAAAAVVNGEVAKGEEEAMDDLWEDNDGDGEGEERIDLGEGVDEDEEEEMEEVA